MTLHEAQRPLINPQLALTASLIYPGNPVVLETCCLARLHVSTWGFGLEVDFV